MHLSATAGCDDLIGGLLHVPCSVKSPPDTERATMQYQPFHHEFVMVRQSPVRCLLPLLLAAALSGCAATERVQAATVVAAAKVGTQQSAVVEFIAAQGTYCNDAIGLSCAENAFYGLGYIYAFCGAGCATGINADFGGVNRKWWDARNPGTYPAAYSGTGTVNETVQRDGRRRLVVNIRAENTFVAFFDASRTSLVGADFYEYPPLGGDGAYLPLTGESTLHADLVLPPGYVGYPDLIEAVSDGGSGIDVRTLNLTATVEGPLRVAYEGIPAGTMVRVQGVSRGLPKLRARQVPSRHLIATDYTPVSRIDVHVLR